MELHDRVAVVTGAGSGIGRAIAHRFARAGALVVAADLDLEAAEATAQLVPERIVPHGVDVRDEASVRALMAATLDRFGRIDILVNNAGIGTTKDLVETDLEEWENVFAVNVRGVFLCCKYALPSMLERRSGVIVNIGSVAGLIGIPKRAAYCASKGAVVTLTKQIAIAYVRHGIRCNCICPGTVDSPWVERLVAQEPDPVAARRALEARQPMGRLVRPEEVAAAALYLASDEAAAVTGSVFVIDGGWLAQ
ncbi:glucose 1-dehydrogenase [Thermomicrobium sp. 4228-Ro]|uniref:SDR family NAD(P)-dependent oxidoreductase n=1 Tax=Thermomicrobium sp. 4228-Ro TaxID=2993937 RepID=UPI002248BCAB|nr:glucose 1-dehydrogenase [Thermomicrobium sp. 4228-Ro]MCX2726821.1 glucose 1-dehydrogenase [Thermomicrobium sp. 4228-Ro]